MECGGLGGPLGKTRKSGGQRGPISSDQGGEKAEEGAQEREKGSRQRKEGPSLPGKESC